ncbi:hypothetical protein Tco_0704214 [Tanacetum coccineum]|uniref:Xylulose kinase-1 n=1 Tax=Tanacetum coccineum TaxID=301880 RepID=A0ABQ4Y316_9ASTR
MSTPKFASTHNLVAFLEKPEESNGFEEIINFLNSSFVQYALTVNPTIYTSCIEQFWATAKVKTFNGERQLQALVDKKQVIITETSIRCDLNLEDAGGTDCFPTDTIFEELVRMRKQRKDSAPTKSTTEETTLEENSRVLALETTKSNQTLEIKSLKRRVNSLEKRRKSRTPGFKRLRKVESASRVESFNDANVLEEQEKDVAEKEVSVVDPVTTAGEVVTTANIEVTTGNAPTTTIDELTLAQTLIEIKAAKPKAVTSFATTTTTTRPKARGVVVQEPSEFKTTSSYLQASQLPQAKDKGKGIMVEPDVPLKKKDQVALDEEMARNLEAQLQA